MSAPPPELSPSWLEREAIYERFEKAWQEHGPVAIADFLPPLEAPQRTSLLRELIKIDQDRRWASGHPRAVEDYGREFPELLIQGRLPLELIVQEIEVRQYHGCPPTDAELQERFGDRAVELIGYLRPTGPVVPEQAEDESTKICSAPALPETSVPRRLGRYELRAEVGSGGFARVYRAWDSQLRREVALKVPRPGLLEDADARARFLREAQSAARLRHPAIVSLHEVGQEGDRTWLVYDFVPGPTLAQVLRQTSPAPQQAAQWMARIAEALDYAHQAGIVHRDVKPANIMLDAAGQPVLTDFGLAMCADAGATLTQQGDILGTPAYMSPEQARGQSHGVDARSDVYSLGVVLYQMICGELPFQAHGAAILQQVIHDEPTPPGKIRTAVPRDLETICLKAMAKEPSRRYATAGALAEDLRRYLNHEPIRARRIGPLGRLMRWAHRNPAVAATLALALIVIATIALVSFRRVIQERDRVIQERDRAQRLSAALALDKGQSLCEQGEVGRGMLWMARALQLAPEQDEELRWTIRANLGAWHRLLSRPIAVLMHSKPVRVVAFSPDGKLLVTACEDGCAYLWDVSSGKRSGPPLKHDGPVDTVAFSPGGQSVLTGSQDGTARLWEVVSGKQLQVLPHKAGVSVVAFSPDGRRALTGTYNNDHSGRQWDLVTGKQVGPTMPHPAKLNVVAYSPDGKTMVTADDQTAQLWDAATGQPLGSPLLHKSFVRVAVFSPDSQTLLTGGYEQYVRLRDARTGNPRGAVLEHPAVVSGALFSPRGGLALTLSSDNSIRFWEVPRGNPLGAPLQHQGAISSAAFSPDGAWLLTGGASRIAQLWDVAGRHKLGAVLQHPEPVRVVAVSPYLNTLLTVSEDHAVRLWRPGILNNPTVTLVHDDPVRAAAYSPDGRRVVTGSGQPYVRGCAQRWDPATGKKIGPPLAHKDVVCVVAVSRNSDSILTGGWYEDPRLQVWQMASGEPLGPAVVLPANVVSGAFALDGRTCMVGCAAYKHIRCWTVNGTEASGPILEHGEPIRSLAASADGSVLLTGSYDKTARLWDAATFKPLGAPWRHQGAVGAVALSPDAKFALTGTDENVAQLWDAATGKPLGPPLAHQGTVRAVAFHPSLPLVLTGSWDRTARLWDSRTSKPVGPAFQQQAEVEIVAFSPDGRTLLAGGWDKTVRFYPVPVPVEGPPDRVLLWVQVLTGMELEDADTIRLLDAPTWSQRQQQLDALGDPLP